MEKQTVLLEIKHVYKIYYNVIMQLAMKYKVQETINEKFKPDSEEGKLMSQDIQEILESLRGLKSILALQLDIKEETEILKKVEEYIKTDPYCILTEKFFENEDFFNFDDNKDIN